MPCSGRWAFLPPVPSSGLWFTYLPSAWRLVVLTLPHPAFAAEYGAGLDLFSPTLQAGSLQSKGDLGEQPPLVT